MPNSTSQAFISGGLLPLKAPIAFESWVSEKLKALKESGVELDADTAAKLEALNAELKSLTTELKNTKGDIKDIAVEKKESIKARDYEAMDAAFVEIGDIQAARNADMTRVNEILKEMNTLLE
jgi:hypothetical protein